MRQLHTAAAAAVTAAAAAAATLKASKQQANIFDFLRSHNSIESGQKETGTVCSTKTN